MTVDEPAALAGSLAGARRTRPRGARAMVGGVMGPPSSPWGGSPEPCADGCGVEFECCEDAGKPAASPDPLRRRAALQDTRCCRRLRAWTRGWGFPASRCAGNSRDNRILRARFVGPSRAERRNPSTHQTGSKPKSDCFGMDWMWRMIVAISSAPPKVHRN